MKRAVLAGIACAALASRPSVARADPGPAAPTPSFACDASRLADLPPAVADAVARDACEALSELAQKEGRFSVAGQREGERYALLVRNEADGESALMLVDDPSAVGSRVRSGAARWEKPRAGRVPETERQLTFSLASLYPLGAPGAVSTLGGSVAYRLATPRWSLGAVAEITAAEIDGRSDGFLHGSLAISARQFSSASDSAWFVGGGLGLLGISQKWSTSADVGCDAICFALVGGDASRSLATFAPFAEGGFALGRSRSAQLVLSLRVDVPFQRMESWTGPARDASPGEPWEHRPAVYVLPISLRLGVQL